ncbi:Abi family protein [Rathayibacter sp. VKM Ac-2754]|uniref:Abi family protein n=1 Tax=Rathayibacter sp. VKM Ac-2754 TaxID=2609251 RepID=UPI003FA7ECB4
MLIDVDAERWLRSVTYYRLSGYLFSYRRTDPVGGRQQRSDSFVPGTPLSQVVALYEFDRILRARVHDGLGMVEVAVRRGLADALGREGPVAYQDPSRFRTGFDHGAWLERANRRVDRVARRSDSIRHHLEKYGGDVPLWVLVDVLDFADLSLLFAGARASDQWAVADDLGLIVDLEALNGNQRAKAARRHPLVNWLEQLTLVRNICAHHARLWNRTVIPAGTAAMRTVPGLESLPHSQSEGVFGRSLRRREGSGDGLPGFRLGPRDLGARRHPPRGHGRSGGVRDGVPLGMAGRPALDVAARPRAKARIRRILGGSGPSALLMRLSAGRLRPPCRPARPAWRGPRARS